VNVNTDSKTIDELFDLFSSDRRRHLWLYMTDTDDEVFSFEELVDHVHIREANVDFVSDESRTVTGIALHHTDLPKLADMGLIEYDTTSGTVRCGNSELSAKP
jgi:hypothetical protein